LKGWIFDVYPVYGGMRLWFIDSSGQKHRFFDAFSPSFCIGGPASQLKKTLSFISRLKLPLRIRPSEGTEFYSGTPLPVARVTVFNPIDYTKVVKWVINLENKKEDRSHTLSLYNCDLSLPQLYFFSKGLFPLAFCELAAGNKGEIQEIELKDSPWATDYTIPPISTLHLKMEGGSIHPDQCGPRPLAVSIEGTTHVIEGGSETETIEGFNSLLKRYDPDLILSEWGDPCILPQLISSAEGLGLSLHLNREPFRKVQSRKEQSYFSYGRIVHKAQARILFGRWHIDVRNSFLVSHTALEGVFEFARLSRIPVQQMARTSTGTGITSMQMNLAFQENILIPWRKREPEGFKSASQLLLSDKGGLTYTPKLGFHEEVGELDFASMYPSIMVKYNISPETINCRCCFDNLVPEIGHHLCKKRKGLIPRFLKPLLDKRTEYKRLLKDTKDTRQKQIYDERQSALKWGLVTTFGYQGYKNARFGKIEAHEAITAYSREKLLQAKSLAEAEGFEMIHAIVDSLMIRKRGTSEAAYEMLARRISRHCEIPIAFEGIFNWVCFPPSKSNPGIATPGRYLGVYRSGKTKLRGIEVRRSDTPVFIKRAQLEMIEILSAAKNCKAYESLLPQVINCFEGYRNKLRSGQVPFVDLAISKALSKAPHEYQKASLIAIVANELAARGVRLMPGQTISYVITEMKARVPTDRARALGFIDGASGYDVEKYEALLRKALEVLIPVRMNAHCGRVEKC
ncbi:MAG: DNA polymerase domain-containing protein, partial [Nitrospiria bacterium]